MVAKARTVTTEEILQSQLLRDILDRAKVGTPTLIHYDGVTAVVVPVEEITVQFSAEELREFVLGWTEADDPDELLTKDEALQLGREWWPQKG